MNYAVDLKLETNKIAEFSDYNVDRLYNNSFVDDDIKLRLIRTRDKSKGCCFNYALKNYNLEYIEDILYYLEYDFKQIDISEIKINDIAVFYDSEINKELSEYNIQHIAVIYQKGKTINDIIIRSKWGTEGIFETNLNTLPDIYGNRVCFFRRKKNLKKKIKIKKLGIVNIDLGNGI